MIFFPAIDLMNGQCVRLIRGEKSAKTHYSSEPGAVALSFAEQGATWIHVVDLDGAFEGVRKNGVSIKSIVETSGLSIEVGGGIRTLDDVSAVLDLGVTRAILGTVAVQNPKLVEQAVTKFGAERIAVGLDARNGKVAVKGWVEDSGLSAVDLGLQIKAMGVKTVIYTDISKDGMMEGPNIPETVRLAELTGLSVVASGGVHTLADMRALRDHEHKGIVGCISGKAIYEGRFTVREGVVACNGLEQN